MRKASIKETGEEISQAEWARFDAGVARAKIERAEAERAARALSDAGASPLADIPPERRFTPRADHRR